MAKMKRSGAMTTKQTPVSKQCGSVMPGSKSMSKR